MEESKGGGELDWIEKRKRVAAPAAGGEGEGGGAMAAGERSRGGGELGGFEEEGVI